MKINKDFNVLKKWWFNFIITPSITFLYVLLKVLISNFTSADKIVMTWLSIAILAFIIQYFILWNRANKYKSIHYLYILLSINVSLFIGYLLDKFIFTDNSWWMDWIVGPILLVVLIFIIKSIIWVLLKWVYKNRISKDEESEKLKNENLEMKEKIEKLRLKSIDEND